VRNLKIVNPEAHAVEIDDWENLLERSKTYVRRHLELFKGREISYDETGVPAMFDGPARAIRCTTAIAESVASERQS
jgi:hypothetical protein